MSNENTPEAANPAAIEGAAAAAREATSKVRAEYRDAELAFTKAERAFDEAFDAALLSGSDRDKEAVASARDDREKAWAKLEKAGEALEAAYDLAIAASTAAIHKTACGPCRPVANTIIDQMGGRRRIEAMVNGRQFSATDSSVSFRFSGSTRANMVSIHLAADDTYEVRFMKVRRDTSALAARFESVYFDQLKPLFEKVTGLYLNL